MEIEEGPRRPSERIGLGVHQRMMYFLIGGCRLTELRLEKFRILMRIRSTGRESSGVSCTVVYGIRKRSEHTSNSRTWSFDLTY